MTTYFDTSDDGGGGGGGGGYTPGGDGRVIYSAAGVLTDSALFKFDGTTFGAPKSPATAPTYFGDQLVSATGWPHQVEFGNLTGISGVRIGQLNNRNMGFLWNYSAAVANAYAEWNSYGYTNRADINFSELRIQPVAGTGSVGFFSAAPTYAGAVRAIFLGNATTPANTNSTGGVVIEALNGQLAVSCTSGAKNLITGAQIEVADADRVATIADRSTAHTAPLTANRTITLPAAASTPNGYRHRVFGPLSMGGFTLTVSGDINIQSAASFVISAADTNVEFEKCTSTWRAI